MSKHNYRTPASPLATHQFAPHDYRRRPVVGREPANGKAPKRSPRLPGHLGSA